MQTTLKENMISAFKAIITDTNYRPITEVNGWSLAYHDTVYGEYISASYVLDYPSGDEVNLHIFTDLDESIEFIKKQTGLKSIEI